MSFKRPAKTVTIHLLAVLGLCQARCPPSDVIFPCVCQETISRSGDEMVCAGHYPLRVIFDRVTKLTTPNNRDLDQLIINNSAITELPSRIFYDITFRKISISSDSLKHIHNEAFMGRINKTIESLKIQAPNLATEQRSRDDLFQAIYKLPNLQSLWLDSVAINEIYDDAFRKPSNLKSVVFLNGIFTRIGKYAFHNKVKFILLHSNQLTEVKNFAFRWCEELELLQIRSNSLIRIQQFAFSMNLTKPYNFYLDLMTSHITTTYDKNAFGHVDAKQPVLLNMVKNNLTFLDERAFKAFFTKNHWNKIIMDNTIDCENCNSYWIIKNRNDFYNQTNHLSCTTGSSIWDPNNFSKCHTRSQIKRCPPQDVIWPCRCAFNVSIDSEDTIICDGQYNVDLKSVFGKLTKVLAVDNRDFNTLIVNNSYIREITSSAFSDITFKEIYIQSTSLSHVDMYAFDGRISDRINEVVLECPGLSEGGDLISALGTLENLHTIELNGAGFKQIPDNAFNLLENLQRFSFINGHFEKVGRTAFGQNIREVILESDKLIEISDQTFDTCERIEYIRIRSSATNNLPFTVRAASYSPRSIQYDIITRKL